KGCVKLVGSPADVASSSEFSVHTALSPFLLLQDSEKNVDFPSETGALDYQGKQGSQISEKAEEIVDLEERKEGEVELAVYGKYAAFSGWLVASLILISAVLMQASRNGNDLWLSYWVDSTTRIDRSHYSMTFYLVILSVFCLLNSIFTLVRAFSFAFGGLRAAVQVHDALLNRLVHSPVLFFDRTPRGRILNRSFSCFCYCHFGFFTRDCRSTSRELRRLDSVSRSPIYASFTETLDGASTIRAFKSEVRLAIMNSLTQWVAAFLILFIALMAVVGSLGEFPISLGTPGLVGLALSYAAPVVSLLGSFLSSFTETEKEMVSVERVRQYMDIPQEENCGSLAIAEGWPFQGQIEFHNVVLRYLPTLPPALCDVTFTIARGTKVGIVGRTGAGKSTILNAIFRLSPICGGYIIIDDLNINHIPAGDLRSRLAIVPQSPFLFQGSLRDNLDPFRVHDDVRLWEVLEKCHIKAEVQASGGLDTQIKESEALFSVGQRQLLCLARAFLKSSKVLCLDECTANIDTHTASTLQNVISSECIGTTVITIAHRISTVLCMDNILVLENGRLVSSIQPSIFLQG
ncbi:hypothetical protein KSS87_015230, partial [Heliosperma pusillum]